MKIYYIEIYVLFYDLRIFKIRTDQERVCKALG